jgi:hypothetical protein
LAENRKIFRCGLRCLRVRKFYVNELLKNFACL